MNKIMTKNKPLPMLQDYSRIAAREGVVLLKNERGTLPLVNEKVAVFGRIQKNYYKSGTGSGGLVNVKHVPSFIEALEDNPLINVDRIIKNIYTSLEKEHPFNKGNGTWASEPWSQVEFVIDNKEIIKASKRAKVAIVIIGRTAGEDKDNANVAGSYQLSKEEELLIDEVSNAFNRTVIILNTGNIIDTNFVNKYHIDALLYAFHGGEQGAPALVDVLTGLVSPSGKLPDTIIKNIDKHPASCSFGNNTEVYYREDIYVGYRYFNTFANEEILYPFGYGLTYSKFKIFETSIDQNDEGFILKGKIKNVGNHTTKEVIQVYFSSPNMLIATPKVQLITYLKTKELKQGEIQDFSFIILNKSLRAFDEEGVIKENAFVVEKGIYNILINTDSIRNVASFQLYIKEHLIIEKLSDALAPLHPFEVITHNNGILGIRFAKPRSFSMTDKIEKQNLGEKTFKSNKLVLSDVYRNPKNIDLFIDGLEDDELIYLTRGEGMSSLRVTPGTAAAMGGISPELEKKGVPVVCLSDGPSGIRLDSGGYATSLPNGTALASSFNDSLVRNLYYLLGNEMKKYHIDVILGPGMNIHRHPLNGRNFEYFSEDPYLTGQMAVNCIEGLHFAGVAGSLKHFAANNQETARFDANSIVSKRALREIYLAPFEMAVKNSIAKANIIMTSYNPINYTWAAGNYDLNTTILRNEWGYQGVVITDWWAKINTDQEEATRTNKAGMIKAQNDVYMVASDPYNNSGNDNLKNELALGIISRAHLHRSAKNILSFILSTPAYKRINNIDTRDNYGFIVYPLIEDDNIFLNNDFVKKGIFNYYLTSRQFASLKINKNSRVLKNNRSVYIFENNKLYTFSKKHRVKKIEEFIFDNSNDDNTYFLEEIIVLSFDKVVQKGTALVEKNQRLTSHGIDNIISFAVKSEKNSAIILSFELSGTSTQLSQLPIATYLNKKQVNLSTINGGDSDVKIQLKLNLKKGLNYLSFKFIKAGLILASVKIEKKDE